MNQILKHAWMAPLVCGLGIMATPLAAQDEKTEGSDSPPPEFKASPGLAKVDGFRDLDFGATVDSFKEKLKLSEDRGALKIYVDEGDKQLLGPVLLDEISYYFLDGKFFAVVLHTDDGTDTSNLIRIFEGAYGPGTPLEEENTYVWKGDKASVRISVSPDGEGEVYISDNALYKAYTEAEEKQVQDAIKLLKE